MPRSLHIDLSEDKPGSLSYEVTGHERVVVECDGILDPIIRKQKSVCGPRSDLREVVLWGLRARVPRPCSRQLRRRRCHNGRFDCLLRSRRREHNVRSGDGLRIGTA